MAKVSIAVAICRRACVFSSRIVCMFWAFGTGGVASDDWLDAAVETDAGAFDFGGTFVVGKRGG